MRAFRLYKRVVRTGCVDKHRDYIGIDNLKKHCLETYKRYDVWDKYNGEFINHKYVTTLKDTPEHKCYPELCENINGKWVKLSQEEVNKLLGIDGKKD